MPLRPDIELLSPARDADIGIEAINHGADAVYIGGPAFGARSSADNSVADIARLVKHFSDLTIGAVGGSLEISPAASAAS